jgi:hypothetical protein
MMWSSVFRSEAEITNPRSDVETPIMRDFQCRFRRRNCLLVIVKMMIFGEKRNAISKISEHN